MADTPKVWVGEFPGAEQVIFDTRCQSKHYESQVFLWGVRSEKFDVHAKKTARTQLRPVRDLAARNDALARYTAFVQKLLEDNHRKWMEALKTRYHGVRISRRSRTAGVHCYICKAELDGTIGLECAACGWGLCECGACGCGRGKQVDYGSRNFTSLSDYAQKESYLRWEALPPRSTDPEELCERIGGLPVKVKYGYCRICDSSLSNDWCVGEPDHFRELWHYAHPPGDFNIPDDKTLRESELTLLVTALDSGQVRGTRLK